jgi:hypothetical protein
MIPTPFVLTDAVVVKGKVKASEKDLLLDDYLPSEFRPKIVIDTLKQSATD